MTTFGNQSNLVVGFSPIKVCLWQAISSALVTDWHGVPTYRSGYYIAFFVPYTDNLQNDIWDNKRCY